MSSWLASQSEVRFHVCHHVLYFKKCAGTYFPQCETDVVKDAEEWSTPAVVLTAPDQVSTK